MTLRRTAGLGLAMALLATLFILPLTGTPATGSPTSAETPEKRPEGAAPKKKKKCKPPTCEAGAGSPGSEVPAPEGENEGDGSGNGGKGGTSNCRYYTWDPIYGDKPDPADYGKPEGSQPLIKRCGEGKGWTLAWGGPGGEPPPPDPQDLLPPVYAKVIARLTEPNLGVQPTAATRGVLKNATFVQITNPPVTIREENTVQGVSVWIEAVPTVTFDPGENGADVVACGLAGTSYARGAGTPRAQATAPGACAHIYELKSGVAGRPDHWDATVTTTYEVTWGSNQPGQNGTFDPVAMSTGFDRIVDDFQTVIEG